MLEGNRKYVQGMNRARDRDFVVFLNSVERVDDVVLRRNRVPLPRRQTASPVPPLRTEPRFACEGAS